MFLMFVLLACSDEIETAACEALDGDVHFLTASTEGMLEEAAAQFHVESHLHSVELDSSGWIWAPATGEQVTIFTSATIASALHDGAEEPMTAGAANRQCSDSLTTSYALTLGEGVWDFQLEGAGTHSWIVVPHDAAEHDHGDHEH